MAEECEARAELMGTGDDDTEGQAASRVSTRALSARACGLLAAAIGAKDHSALPARTSPIGRDRNARHRPNLGRAGAPPRQGSSRALSGAAGRRPRNSAFLVRSRSRFPSVGRHLETKEIKVFRWRSWRQRYRNLW